MAKQETGKADGSSNPPMRKTGGLDFFDSFTTMSQQRKHLTQLRTRPSTTTPIPHDVDFLGLVSLICDIYQSYEFRLVPMTQFHSSWEVREGAGNNCIVSSRSIFSQISSATHRGKTRELAETIVVKRTKRHLLGTPAFSAIKSLVTELRVRSHPPLRSHPNIVNLKGIAWDFESNDYTKPQPLLLEEFAQHRSLAGFWTDHNMVRMPFRVKARLCGDIARGIRVLHDCGIVHGDIKPDNVLIFSNTSSRQPYVAKLSDFGHSICKFENLTTLPAWTPGWCAPEADLELCEGDEMSFSVMLSTDVYSFGLVAASVIIGKSIFSDRISFSDKATVSRLKEDDLMLEKVIDLIVREDRENKDSDFDLVVIESVLRCCLQKDLASRQLLDSIRILDGVEECLNATETNEYFFHSKMIQPCVIEALPAIQPLLIGYQSLHCCSYLVKSKITTDVERVATDDSDPRQAGAAWELCICCYHGFGVQKDWPKSRRWLAVAARLGHEAAQAFFLRIHDAMSADTADTLHNSSNPHSVIAKWLVDAVSRGCVTVIPDLRRSIRESDPDMYRSTMEAFRETLADYYGIRVSTADNSQSMPMTSTELIAAIATGKLDNVKSILSRFPDLLNAPNARGDTPLLTAARFGNVEILQHLLQEQEVKADVYNNDHQTVFHFLPILDEHHIMDLVPQLVDLGANPSREGLPVQYSVDAVNISLPVRCSSLLNAIIQGSMSLLKALIGACHSENSQLSCPVCGVGSRYRKLVGVAISLHSHTAIGILLNHLQEYGLREEGNISKIELWDDDQLIPLRRVVFQGFVQRGLDLPESFVRAINHGADHLSAMQTTIDYLINDNPDSDDEAHELLLYSVRHESIDALDHLLHTRFRHKHLMSIWLERDFPKNPLFASIRLGFRSIFDRLLGIDTQLFRVPTVQSNCNLWCSTWHSKSKRHLFNMAHLALSTAVTAAHSDLHFVNSILDHSTPAMIESHPNKYDEYLSRQPASFMARAIFADHRAATAIVSRHPRALLQKVPQIHPRFGSSRDYAAPYNSAFLRYNKKAPTKSMPLGEFVFLVGSRDACRQFLNLRALTQQQRQQVDDLAPLSPAAIEMGRGSVVLHSREDSRDWKEEFMSLGEFHYLVLGLIVDARDDRNSLWELVECQVNQRRHSRDEWYLRLAIMCADCQALSRLLSAGWTATRSPWVMQPTPLDLAYLLKKHQCYSLPKIRDVRHWTLGSPTEATQSYPRDDEDNFSKTISLLEEHGAKELIELPRTRLGILFGLVLVHGVIIPTLVGRRLTVSNTDTTMKWVSTWVWSLSLMVNIVLYLLGLRAGLIYETTWACSNTGPPSLGISSFLKLNTYNFWIIIALLIHGAYIALAFYINPFPVVITFCVAEPLIMSIAVAYVLA